jgi:NAD(P)-dependent dehydrogenase (short-subunit alcohol dehydrogenase family)
MRFLFSLQTVFGTNVFGNALIAAHFLASGSESKVRPRAILNISSFMVHSNPAPHQAAYATSKAAFAHLLQLLADEIPAKECQIINMHPGAILTEAAERDAPQAVKDSVVWDQGEHERVGFD